MDKETYKKLVTFARPYEEYKSLRLKGGSGRVSNRYFSDYNDPNWRDGLDSTTLKKIDTWLKLGRSFTPGEIEEKLTAESVKLLEKLKDLGVNLDIISGYLKSPKRNDDWAARIYELIISKITPTVEEDVALYRLLHNTNIK